MSTKFFNETSVFDRLLSFRSNPVTKTLLFFMVIIYSIPVYPQSVPAAPVSVTANPAAVCPSSPYSLLKAVSPGNTIKWYTVSSGGESIGTSASGTSFSVTIGAPTTYYAESITTAGVTSSTRTAVTIGVNTVPVITYMPSDVVEQSNPGQCGSVVNYPNATATGTPAPEIIYSSASGSDFNVGSTTVLISAVNVCATTSLSFDVTVNDIEKPAIIAPPNVAVTAPAGATSVSGIDLGTPVAYDNCGSVSVSNNAPSTFYGGNTTVTWTATDEHDNTSTASQQVVVIVSNMPPVISGISTASVDNIIAQGSPVALTTQWTDEIGGGPYKVDIDWRDSSSHTIINGITAYKVTVNHTYNKTGVFAPVVKVTDGSNLSSTLSFKYLVVYVVGNYSTTAEGKFTAPVGSLASNPSASNLKVEFASECKPKSCRPGVFDGSLELEISNTNFEFETEDIDWDYLAVAGCYLAEFKGSGYMYPNGHHGSCRGGCHNACNIGYNPGYHYGILIVQSDKTTNASNKNKIRIKIWNKDAGNAVIFDTQPGAPDDALPITVLSSGSIKVKVPSSCVPRFLSPTYLPDKTDDDVAFESSVSPNPFVNDFTLNFNSGSSEKIQIAIYNVVGKLIQTMNDVEPNMPVEVPNNFAAGIYYLHATQGNKTKIVKLVKNQR